MRTITGVRTAALVMLGALLVGCASDSTATEPAAGSPTTASIPIATAHGPDTTLPGGKKSAQPTSAARVTTMSFVDDSRPTDAGAASEAADSRTLTTKIYIPAGTGPFPLVVFAHGLSGHPDDFTRLLNSWAEAGLMVAAPAFPLTNTSVPESGANFADVRHQPGDVSFVIDEMLRLDADTGSEILGLVDEERIGASGLSLGGITTYATAFSDCCRDDRIDAAVVLAGAASTGTDFGAFVPSDLPILVMHGEADGVITYAAAQDAYTLLGPPKFLVTLLGGGHAEPFADQSVEFAPIVDATTVDFWNAYLLGDAGAVDALVADALVEGLTLLEYSE